MKSLLFRRSGNFSLPLPLSLSPSPSTFRALSLFSRTPSLKDHKAELARAIVSKNPQALHAPYAQIAQHVRENPQQDVLSSQQLVDILSILSSSSLSTNFILLRTVYDDLSELFLAETTMLHKHLLLRGYCKALRADDAFEWIKNGMYTDSSASATTQDCNLVLEAYVNSKSPKDSTKIIDYMQQKRIPRSAETYILLFRLFFDKLQDLDKARQIQSELQSEHEEIKSDTMVLSALLDGYGSVKYFESADVVCSTLEQKLSRTEALLGDDPTPYNSLVQYYGRVEFSGEGGGNIEAVLDRCTLLKKDLEERNLSLTFPDDTTLKILAQVEPASISCEEALDRIRLFEKNTNVPVGSRCYGAFLERILERRPLTQEVVQEAKNLYNHAFTNGVTIGCEMVLPILRTVASATNSQFDFQVCKKLWAQVASLGMESGVMLPTLEVFSLLFSACSTARDMSLVPDICKTMNEFGLRFSRSQILDQMIPLIQASNNFQEAFTIYTWLQGLHNTVLQLHHYNSIISAFTKLQFPDQFPDENPVVQGRTRLLLPPPLLFVQIIKDMRAAGFPPDRWTYTTILYYYSKIGIEDPMAVRSMHNTLKLDPSFEPDRPVFNALIAAYSRAHDYDGAMAVWKFLLANPRLGIDNISVNVILDLCSFAGLYETAKQIWEARIQEGFPLNKKNWDTWVECLSRLGEMDHVLRVIEDDMGSAGFAADAMTCSIPMKFAKRGKVYEHVRQRLRKSQSPEIWNEIKSIREDEV